MGRRQGRTREAPEVKPLDVDGVRTVAVITVVWAVAFVVLAVRRADLVDAGRDWWLWTCLAGVGLGLLGLEYCRRRRDAIARADLEAEADADFDDFQDWADGELAALAADDPAEPDYDELPPQAPAAEMPWPAHPTPPAGLDRPPADTREPLPGRSSPPVPHLAPPPEAGRPGAAGGRPPPGHITGDFPVVPPQPAPEPAVPPRPPHPPPETAIPAVPPPSQPDPVGTAHPDPQWPAAPAGYSPDPDRTRRHPRDEEIARRYREEQERSQPAGTPSSELLSDELPVDEFVGRPGDEQPPAEFEPRRSDVAAWPAEPAEPEPPRRATPAFDSEFFSDEPVPEPRSGPDFLLDEPDPDESESGGRRGRHTRSD